MKFEHTLVQNFEGAFRGLRNPLESWNKSDSYFGLDNQYSYMDFEVANLYCQANGINFHNEQEYDKVQDKYAKWLRKNGILRWDTCSGIFEFAFLGPKDLDLAHRMIKAGDSDSKFLRQIMVSVDITAPIYWWKEMDTYKIGTVANSTSTMHKLATTPITIDCFETDDINNVIVEDSPDPTFIVTSDYAAKTFIQWLEELRQKYLETKDKKYWKQLIRWLPESWLQKRTITMNYAVLRNQYFQRKNHKLSEWHQYCKWIESLPYANDLIIYTDKN